MPQLGALLEETFGLPYWAGVVGIMVAVGALVLGGSRVIEGVMTSWSVVLYLAYVILFCWCFSRFGDEIISALLEAGGAAGAALACTLAYERGDWDQVHFKDLPQDEIRVIYLQAIAWADELSGALIRDPESA